jgi:hypothetical protein
MTIATSFIAIKKPNSQTYAVGKVYDSGRPSVLGEMLYNQIHHQSDAEDIVNDNLSFETQYLHEIKCSNWSYLFLGDLWYVKKGETEPFVPLTDYMIPFAGSPSGDQKFSDTPFRSRNNIDHLYILFDIPFDITFHNGYNAPKSSQSGKPMELEELLKKTAELFAAFEHEKTNVGCSIIIENLPYVYTYNSDTKSFDRDDFPEL